MKYMIALLFFSSIFLLHNTGVPGHSIRVAESDTLSITTNGSNNIIAVDSLIIMEVPLFSDSLSIKGTIVQKGQNNSIIINSGRNKPQTKSEKHTVTIKQSGNNNSVKINQR
jgi:hypothetical protein